MSSLFFFLPEKIFAIIIGAVYFKRLPTPYKLVFYLIIIASIFESYGYYISQYTHKTNAWVFNFYIIVEVWLLGIAAIYLSRGVTIRKVFFSLLVVNSAIWVIDICINSIFLFANLSMVCGSIILTFLYILILYYNLFSVKGVLQQPIFWLSVSTILYFGCDTPYMGLHNYLATHSPNLATELDYINRILDIIRYPLVAISFILLGRQKKVALKAA